MKVSVIVLAWNGMAYLETCLNAVLTQDYPDFEIIVVDNDSSDGSADFIAEHYPQLRLIRNQRNLGFAGGCNVGLRAAQGQILILLNQDLQLLPGGLRAIRNRLSEPQVGVVGAKVLGPEGTVLLHAGGYLEWPQALGKHIGTGEVDSGQYDRARQVEYVTGACLAFRREVVQDIGLLDEMFYPAFYEDVDFCWRARRNGWEIWYDPAVVGIHDESSSTRHHWPSRHYYHYRNRMIFLFKHFSKEQIRSEFVPAEQQRLATVPVDQLRAARSALTELLALNVGNRLASNQADCTEPEFVGQILRELREIIVRVQGGDPALMMPRRPLAGELSPDMTDGGMPGWIQEVKDLWEVRPPKFASQAPIVGNLIAGFRDLWNSVATKWYVEPLFSQQVQFNGTVVRALLQLQRSLSQLQYLAWDSDALLAMLAERCGELEGRIACLEQSLAESVTDQGKRSDGTG